MSQTCCPLPDAIILTSENAFSCDEYWHYEVCFLREHYDYVLNSMQFEGEGFWAHHPSMKIERNVRAVFTRNNNSWQKAHPSVVTSVQHDKKKALAFLEDSLTMNPDSSIIRDVVREEERQSDEDEDDDVFVLRRRIRTGSNRTRFRRDLEVMPIILPDVKCVTVTESAMLEEQDMELNEETDCVSENTV